MSKMSKIGRPKLYDEKTTVFTMKIPESKKEDLSEYLYECRNNYLEGKIKKSIDTEILKKMIPAFIDAGIKLDSTTEIEDKRIMELIQECL